MLDLDLAAGETRNIEQVFDQPGLPRHGAVNRFQGLLQPRAVNSTPDDLHSPHDTLERRAQFMRNHRQEVIFGSISRLGLGPCLLGVAALGLFKRQQFVELLLGVFALGNVDHHENRIASFARGPAHQHHRRFDPDHRTVLADVAFLAQGGSAFAR